MDLSKTYIGRICRYEPTGNFGFVQTADNLKFFFRHDKAEMIRQRKEGLPVTVQRHLVDDEVEFKLRPSLISEDKFEAFDLVFLRNQPREQLLHEAANQRHLSGYLKLFKGSKLIVKHINTKVVLPVHTTEWETDLQDVYYSRLDTVVKFTLKGTYRIDRLEAIIEGRKMIPEYKVVLDLFTTGNDAPAVITGRNCAGYFVKLVMHDIKGFIPFVKGIDAADFFIFDKGDFVAVTVKFIGVKKMVSFAFSPSLLP